MRVFQPHGRPRIVLATNVAETSLTVPGIKYVIDPGFARISRYSAAHARCSGCRSSRSARPAPTSARAAAAGSARASASGSTARRTSQPRRSYTDPEILRTNLASVILQMKSLRLGDVQDFPFLEPPDYRPIRDGYADAARARRDRREQRAHAAGLPAGPPADRPADRPDDPGGPRTRTAWTRCWSSPPRLSVQDPRERPMDKPTRRTRPTASSADEQQRFPRVPEALGLLPRAGEASVDSKLRKLCQENFLSFVRMREWHDVHNQLKELVAEMGLYRSTASAESSAARGAAARDQKAASAGAADAVVGRWRRPRQSPSRGPELSSGQAAYPRFPLYAYTRSG